MNAWVNKKNQTKKSVACKLNSSKVKCHTKKYQITTIRLKKKKKKSQAATLKQELKGALGYS